MLHCGTPMIGPGGVKLTGRGGRQTRLTDPRAPFNNWAPIGGGSQPPPPRPDHRLPWTPHPCPPRPPQRLPRPAQPPLDPPPPWTPPPLNITFNTLCFAEQLSSVELSGTGRRSGSRSLVQNRTSWP